MRRRVAHIVPELRAVHVERYAAWAPDDTLLYRELKWDLEQAEHPSAQHLTPSSLFRTLRDQTVTVIELPEPLWMREALFTAGVVLLARAVRHRSVLLTAYCIENNDFESLTGYRGPFIGTSRTLIAVFLRSVVGRQLDRLVYGSHGARETYESVRIAPRASAEMILELPQRAPDLCAPDGRDVLFVGRLEERKGVLELMHAWNDLEPHTDASITLIGDGPLREAVETFVAENPARRRALGHLTHREVGRIYVDHRVLVAPSRRDGRWREQIGLPICEALAHGLTVVSSAETGLAEWLKDEGHSVVEPTEPLADAILERINAPLSPSSVAESLPLTGGRQRADEWLRS